MLATPADPVNQALDALAVVPIGSLGDGTPVSEAARRHYGQTLRQLLRSAHWSFARKQAALLLLGDASGQTPDAGTIVEPPWQYAYAWPNDGVQAIWMPWQMPAAPVAPIPQMTGLATTVTAITSRPARFLISSSEQYPIAAGQLDWSLMPDLSGIEGQGLRARRVVLTNVSNATLVYTKLALEIEEWDSLFREAFVSALAARLAITVVEDKKLAFTLRQQQIALAKDTLAAARAATANDAGFPKNVDHVPDWFMARRGGAGGWWPGWDAAGPGMLFQGWQSFSFPDGSVF